jgi:chaperone modulatory protein CbpM
MSETGYYLTLAEVSQTVKLSSETVISIVQSGIVEPMGEQPQQWLFAPLMVKQIQHACRLQSDLELDWPAVALALDLSEDLHRLREENRRLRRLLAALANVDVGD